MYFSKQSKITKQDQKRLEKQLITPPPYLLLSIGIPETNGWTDEDFLLAFAVSDHLWDEQWLEYVFTLLLFIFLCEDGILEQQDLVDPSRNN